MTTGYVGGDDGLGGARSFKQRSGCSFPIRRKNDAIGLVNKPTNIACRPQVLNCTGLDPLINCLELDAAFMLGVFGSQDLKTSVYSLTTKLFYCLNVFQHTLIGY